MVGLGLRDLYPDTPWIRATYDYRDEDGTLLYQSLRLEPKAFRQRCPREGGGWDWSTKKCRRVLYRLLELLGASKDAYVFVVEGEKDVDRLRALGLIATTNIGGAGKWRPEYSEPLRGRHVVILPDNDPPGRDHAQSVARHLHGIAESVKIVELPGLSPKGDVSDWLDAGGTKEALIDLAENTSIHRAIGSGSDSKGNAKGRALRVAKNPTKTGGKRDAEPDGLDAKGNSKPDGYESEGDGELPFGSGRIEVPPFPSHVFPDALRSFIESSAAAFPCPPDFIGTMMLVVLGALVGMKRRIEIKPDWAEVPLLWTAVIARSGERKSPAYELVTKPLRAIQKSLVAEHIAAERAWEALPKEEQATTPRPRLQQVLTTDTTIEALKDILDANPMGIAYPADELAGWVNAIAQYKGGKGDDRTIWLSIWSSTQIVSNRRGNPQPIIIDSPFVAITGGIQPDALPDIVDDAREDGLAARFLFAWPDALPPAPWTDDVVQQAIKYALICKQLWDLRPQNAPHKVDSGAKAAWVEWVNAHRLEARPDNLRPTWSKAEGNCLRVALVLHLVRQLCNETRSSDVDGESMSGAIALIEYFKAHAKRVFGNIAATSGNDRIPRALRWVRKHGGRVTARMAKINGFVKDTAEAIELFDALQDFGHGEVSEGKQGSIVFTLREGS